MKRTLSLLPDNFTAKRQSRLLHDALLYTEEETRELVDFSIIELEQKSQLEAVNEFNITNNQFHYQLHLPIDAEAMPAEEEKIFYAIIKGTDPNISNNILGFLHLKKEEIIQLFIEDSKREQGIGRDLVQTCKTYLTNLQKYIVHTYSAEDATGFWKRIGFNILRPGTTIFYNQKLSLKLFLEKRLILNLLLNPYQQQIQILQPQSISLGYILKSHLPLLMMVAYQKFISCIMVCLFIWEKLTLI